MFGTLTTLDTVEAARNTTVFQFGMERIFDAIEAAFNAQNDQLVQQLYPLCNFTTERYVGTASPADDAIHHKIGEFGVPRPQKTVVGAALGFPMDDYGAALQWTRDYLRRRQASEFAAQVRNIMRGDRINVIKQIKNALFRATNFSFEDYLTDHVANIPVKAIANADGFPLPVDPNGNTFNASTHTHLLGAAVAGTFAAADATAAVETVLEHFNDGVAQIWLNRAQEVAMRAFTGFTPYVDSRITPATTATRADGVQLNPVRLYNRPIGIFNQAEVWIKPWMPASYMVTVMLRNPDQESSILPPLGFREDQNVGGDLQLVFDDERFPLQARAWMRRFGLGVWNRVAVSILDIAHTTYNAITF